MPQINNPKNNRQLPKTEKIPVLKSGQYVNRVRRAHDWRQCRRGLRADSRQSAGIRRVNDVIAAVTED
ncbi:hypothetical protein BVI434_570015 [Burkholderia vietnamiensis]|nr:hypothetical protein BVI434_570015 [Burkholderia vietnamiensis]